MNYEEAKNCVLAELEIEFGEGIQLMDDQIIEKPYGWFFLQHERIYRDW